MTKHPAVSPNPAELLAQRDWILRLAETLVRDPGRAADVAQEALVAAWSQPPGHIQNLRAWLGQVVRRQVQQGLRADAHRLARETQVARSERQRSNAELSERAECHRRLVEHVLALPEEHSLILLQRYFDGQSPQAIARGEGCSSAAVSNRLTRAHAALRQRLAQHQVGRDWLAGLAPLLLPSRSRTAASLLASGLAVLFSGAKLKLLLGGLVLALGLGLFRLGQPSPLSPGAGTPALPLAQATEPQGEEGGGLQPLEPGGTPRLIEPLPQEAKADLSAGPRAAPPKACRVQGLVMDPQGRPLAMQQLVIARPRFEAREFLRDSRSDAVLQRTASQADGSYGFEGLEPGRYAIGTTGIRNFAWTNEAGQRRIVDVHGSGAALLEPLRIEAGRSELEHNITIWNELHIRGRVVYPDGQPAPDVRLLATLPGVTGSLAANSDEHGAFSMGPLPPGQYSLFDNGSPEGWSLTQTLRVQAGSEDVHLVLSQAGSLAGRLIHPGGEASLDGWLNFRQEPGSPRPGAGVSIGTSPDDRDFRVSSIDPATYTIQFDSDDARWFGILRAVRVDPGQAVSDLQLKVQPAAQLLVKHRGQEGTLFAYVTTPAGSYKRIAIAAGSEQVYAVPPGSLSVRFVDRKTKATTTVELQAKQGETALAEYGAP